MDNYKIGDEVELLEDFYTRSGAEIIFKKGTIAKVIELQLYDEIHIDVNGDNRWCSPDILKLVDKKDPVLISGAEAHQALLAGENVQYSGDGGEEHWDTALNCNIGVFLNQEKFPSFKFRIAPRTIKVNSELPKPNKETQHNSLVYAVTYEFKTREERNAFADKLRGTNS
ncbi:hypothetical protein IEC338SC_3095 [Acinetobacter pittii]|uniref:Uncharacterized protein n=1 Tax=Acinetobacter pittii TaxID=48296 RepID=A0AB33BER5_ACIPI|nr:hypothetical protein [Acinetobacter pittii]AMX20209.1 hypothetical protein IEC338SC_3095 [Acinetobacter pittii]